MQYSFFTSRDTLIKSWGALSILLLTIWYMVSIQVSINEWYGNFYNLLQKADENDISLFWNEMETFAILVTPYIIVSVFSSWLARIWALWWREKITFDAVHIFRSSDKSIINAAQRVQEDAYRFARIVENLGLQFAKAILTLIAFLPLLYTLSAQAVVPYLENIDGSLVYVAVGTSFLAIIISWYIGFYLPKLEYNNAECEGSFRKELTLWENDKVNYGKQDTIVELFTGLKFNYKKLFNHYGYFDLWLNTFEQFMVILPYLVMAPALFTGAILLGVMVQVSNAFRKTTDSLNIVLTNWVTINELRSIHRRLKEFETVLKN